MYLAFKWLLEQNLGKESGGAEVAKVAVVEAMLSLKLEHGQWALGVIQRLYDYFVSDNKGKERVKAMLDACAVSAEGAVSLWRVRCRLKVLLNRAAEPRCCEPPPSAAKLSWMPFQRG